MPDDNLTSKINDEEDPQETFGSPPNTVQVITDDSPEPNDPRELQEASSIPPNKKGKKRKRCIWSTPKKRRQKKRLPKGKASPRQRNQEKLQVVEQATQRKDDSPRKSNVMPSAQKASAESAQSSGPEETSDDSPEMNEEKSLQEEPPSTAPSTPHVLFPALDAVFPSSLQKTGRRSQVWPISWC